MAKASVAKAGSKNPKQDPAMTALYKQEPVNKRWLHFESMLVNLTRKLREDQRLAVYVFAERAALSRIKARHNKRNLPHALEAL